MVLNTIKEDLSRVLDKYSHLEFSDIKERQEEIANDPEVQRVRKDIAEFMDYGRSSLETVVNICVDNVRNNYRRRGIGFEEEPHKEVEIVCDNHSHPHIIGRGIFGKNTPLDQINFKHSNLVYSHYKEKIKNGMIVCNDCGQPGRIGEVLTTIVLRRKVDEFEARREIVKDFANNLQSFEGKKRSLDDIRKNILNPIVEKHGFTNLYNALEATRAFTVNLEDMFGMRNAMMLRDTVEKNIPEPILTVTYNEKDNWSLADKYIIVAYGLGEKKRYLHDICRVRIVPYGGVEKCIDIADIFREKAKRGIIRMVEDEDYTGGTGTGYQAVHLDIDVFNTGIVCEVQIRENRMDTAAVIGEGGGINGKGKKDTAHHAWSSNRSREIDKFVREEVGAEKLVYLVRLFLDPATIKSYRSNGHQK